MIYTIQRRLEFGYGSVESHYEVMRYDHRSTVTGALVGGSVLHTCKTKKEAKAYCKEHGINWVED